MEKIIITDNHYSFAEEWLFYIQEDIKKKYKIDNPIFFINKNNWDKKRLLRWISKKHSFPRRVYYKRINGNCFELKDFFHVFNEFSCLKTIESLLNAIRKDHPQAKIFYKIGRTIFSENLSRRQILINMRCGYEEIMPMQIDDSKGKNRIIYDSTFGHAETYHQAHSIFTELEYKD